VVSKDGTLFNKAGLITGGFSEHMREKASRFDRNEVAKLEEKQQQVRRQIDELADESALRQKIEEYDHNKASAASERQSVLVRRSTAAQMLDIGCHS
jgi:hypothetical protein